MMKELTKLPIAILKKLDIKEIKLITNNPNKIVDVEQKGSELLKE